MSGTIQSLSFTGSLPFDNRVDVLMSLLPFGPNYLRRLPQGEVERRETWVLPMIDALRTELKLELAVEGQPAYGRLPQYRYIGDVPSIPPVLGIGDEIQDLQRAMELVRGSGCILPTEVVQVGVPHSIDLAGFCFTPSEAERMMPAIEELIASEMVAVAQQLGRNAMAIMLESPFSLQSLLEAQADGGKNEVRRLIQRFARSFASLARLLPRGMPILIHLCNGDFQGRSKHDWTSIELMVRLANATYDHWPHAKAELAGIHLPVFGGANQPIPLDLDASRFDPLGDLEARVPVIYGGIHPMVTAFPQMKLEDVAEINQRALGYATDRLGRQFDAVSWPCGGGRFKEPIFAYDLLSTLVEREGVHELP